MSLIRPEQLAHGPWTLDDVLVDTIKTTFIIAIPAIGTGIEATWGSFGRQWLQRLESDVKNTVLLHYDHLSKNERQLLNQAPHPRDAEDLYKRLRSYDVEHWAARFLDTLQREQGALIPVSCQLLFICHSTGGIVLKEAITHSEREIARWIKPACLLITFLSTPHHGSRVFSDSGRLTQLKSTLGHENVLGGKFHAQMKPHNDYLEGLNQKFIYHCLSVYLWTYGEQDETRLPEGAPTGQPGGEIFEDFLDVAHWELVVDDASSKITNRDENIVADEEEWWSLATDHMGTARLAGSEVEYNDFVDDLRKELRPESIQRWTNHRKLVSQIFETANIERHIFDPVAFDNKTTVRIKSQVASLQAFIEPGRYVSQKTKSMAITVDERYVKENDEKGDTKDVHQVFNLGLPLDQAWSRRPEPARWASENLLDGQRPRNSSIALGIPKASTMPVGRSALGEYHVADGLDPSSPLRPSIGATPALSGSPERLSVDGSIDAADPGIPRVPRLADFPLPEFKVRGLSEHFKPFQWLHVPHCVPSWVPLIMSVISTSKSTNLHKVILTEELWGQHHNNPTHDSAHGRFVRPHTQPLLTRRHSTRDSLPAISSSIDHPQFVLYLPYLHWDTVTSMRERRRVVEKRSQKTEENTSIRVRPVWNEMLEPDGSVEQKIIWQYLISDVPVHTRRTLDQYGYPSLRSTDDRDEDQVLSKYNKSIQQQIVTRLPTRARRQYDATTQKEPEMPNFVLMVDTLWLWILDDATIVSFAPRREKDKGNFPKKFSHHEADPVLELLHSLKRERKWEINDCFDLAALLIYYSVDTLLKGPVGSSVQVLRAFEGFASDKVNSMTKTYKTFRKTQKFENTQFDIEDDLNNTIELRDITDEIEILLKLIGEQLKLVQDIKTKYETQINKEEKRGRKGVAFLHFAEERLHSYQEQLIDLKKSTSQARDSYTELINLKESHSAVRQSRIVNIFTLVTIIFSPLSFFAGIFGMNVSDWSSMPSNPGLYEALEIMLLLSFAFIVVLLAFAFHKSMSRTMTRGIEYIQSLIEDILVQIIFVYLLIYYPLRDKMFREKKQAESLKKPKLQSEKNDQENDGSPLTGASYHV